MITVIDSATRRRSHVRLTDREREILRVIAEGHKSREAAEILVVSKRTVDFHLRNAFDKLNVNNRMAAVREATRLGQLEI